MKWSARSRLVRVLVALVLVSAGYYLTAQGYFGSSLGEARYSEIPGYFVMMVAGMTILIAGLVVLSRMLFEVLRKSDEL